MAKFKVIDPKGFHLGGKHHQKGDTFEGETKNAHICTGLHFKQINKVSYEPAAADPKKPAAAAVDPKGK
jgi:hypothetical protein